MIWYDSIDGLRVFIGYPEFQNENDQFLINMIICSPQLPDIRRRIKAVNLKCSTFDHWKLKYLSYLWFCRQNATPFTGIK